MSARMRGLEGDMYSHGEERLCEGVQRLARLPSCKNFVKIAARLGGEATQGPRSSFSVLSLFPHRAL